MIDLENLLKGALPKEIKEEALKVKGKDVHDLITGSYIDEDNLVYKVEQIIPLEDKGLVIPEIILNYSGIREVNVTELLFLDTETTGLSGGTGTYTFLVGCGFVRNSNFVLYQYLMKDPAGEEILVTNLLKLFEEFQCMVTFNGKSFDIPLLKTRFTLHWLDKKLDKFDQLDLLHLSRRLWKNSLDSCNLQNLEDKILKINRDPSKEIPGSEIPWVYFDYLDSGDATFMINVIMHNQADIVNMFRLFEIIIVELTQLEPTFNENSPDWLEVARLWEEFGSIDIAIEKMRFLVKQKYRERDSRRRLSYIYKKEGKFHEAVLIWKCAAEDREIYGTVELAKFYEHREKNLKAAYQATLKGIEIVEQDFPFEKGLLADLNHRLERIKKKNNAI